MVRETQDHYFREAKKHGYQSRAAYKLIEIDDRKDVLLKADRVLDCGAAPGSWTQVALQRIGRRGCVVAIDLQQIRLPADPRLRIIQDDFTAIPPGELLPQDDAAGDDSRAAAGLFNVILSDMAPSTTGDRLVDHYGSIRLCEAVLDRAPVLLAPGGRLVMKVFEGEAYPDLMQRCKVVFKSVKGFRPKASRDESTEMFIVAGSYRPPAEHETPVA